MPESDKHTHAAKPGRISMANPPRMDRSAHGTLPDGREVATFTLENDLGQRARISEWGATLLSFETPDRNGESRDVTLGFDSFEGWLGNPAYLGSSVGRFGNRIREGRFRLDGQDYQVATNEDRGIHGAHHLHGGIAGFDKRLWHGAPSAPDAVTFSLVSPAGEEGYPGTLEVRVTYRLTADGSLVWHAEAHSDAATPVNLVHHSYWNLSGDPSQPITHHELQLEADHFLPTDAALLPTGERAPVAGTPMDFTAPQTIGARIEAEYEPLHVAGGYDHCWVLRPGAGVRRAATLWDPSSGRTMEIFTDQPAIQLYTGNFLSGEILGKNAIPFRKFGGLCLETEGFPDAPNHPEFPSCILRPGEHYHHTMIHRFSVAQ